MTDDQILDLVRATLWVSLVVATPPLAAALVFGVAIGILQALTSIQEMTLSFVPKLVAMAIVFWMSLSFMTQSLVDLLHERIIPVVAGA